MWKNPYDYDYAQWVSKQVLLSIKSKRETKMIWYSFSVSKSPFSYHKMGHVNTEYISVHVSHTLIQHCVVFYWAAIVFSNDLCWCDGVWVMGPVLQCRPALSYYSMEKTCWQQRSILTCWCITYLCVASYLLEMDLYKT